MVTGQGGHWLLAQVRPPAGIQAWLASRAGRDVLLVSHVRWLRSAVSPG